MKTGLGTVDNYITNLFALFEVKTRVSLIILIMKNRLVQ